jgi:hypothetical protein
VIAALLLLVAQTRTPPRDAGVVTAASGAISGAVMTDEAQPRPVRGARVMVNGEALSMDADGDYGRRRGRSASRCRRARSR